LSTALLVARCALAAVFLTAAISKLLDRDRFGLALKAFGAPARLTAPLSVAVPVLELALAILLLEAGTAQAAAIGAMALLAVFSVAISRALRLGVEADCGCFGEQPSPVSNATLMRNAGLIVLTAPVAVAGPGGTLSSAAVPAETVLVLAALGAAAILGAFCWQLIRRKGRLDQRVRTIEAGLTEALREESNSPPI